MPIVLKCRMFLGHSSSYYYRRQGLKSLSLEQGLAQ